MGCFRVRALAWQGQAELCGVESDHIHNLPDLLADYTPEKLHYYWNVERPEYIRQWEWISWMDGRNSGNDWATGSITSTP